VWQANGTGRSETRENEGAPGSGYPASAASADAVCGTAEVEQPLTFRLRNLTGREFCLIYRLDDGTEVMRRIPPEQIKIRVRFNRLFDPLPTEWYSDPEGSNGKIPMVESRPRPGLLPTCETIDGLPPAEGGMRLVVGPEVVFGLARRGSYRRDLLTLGRARKDPMSHRVIGFENLNRVNFDSPPDLAEIPSLIQEEV